MLALSYHLLNLNLYSPKCQVLARLISIFYALFNQPFGDVDLLLKEVYKKRNPLAFEHVSVP